MSLIIFDPETGTVLGAENAVILDSDELEARITDFTEESLRGDYIESVAQALVDEHPLAQQIASEIGKPVV